MWHYTRIKRTDRHKAKARKELQHVYKSTEAAECSCVHHPSPRFTFLSQNCANSWAFANSNINQTVNIKSMTCGHVQSKECF